MKQADYPAEGEFVSSSPEETIRFGESIARRLGPGSIVALSGNLGAGKTLFAKGIGRGLGVTEEITSPTYTIISEYEGTYPLYHMDAYRLSGDEEFLSAGGEELLYGAGICVVEWADRLSILPRGIVSIHIDIAEDQKRLIRYKIET
ncbi:MAG: tRNA (adenosine(37)-N6)-threonylcarbamoyltransferase complex ATPase subunit type 1 TsaE [Spirochaetaceae bacterium]|jgi:tRNA threonylcarbamoyladenosine biosynthesis protein TsaE|nr:tRNA (adenosine(37)-N6)-threonylcarbamoyltransferase complex ATPase subunit type 1 TsaE [Spirochaetaceae bacterium]